MDTSWGLEEDDDGYTFATVPRSQDLLILKLEKQSDSERFLLGSEDALVFRTMKQQEAWEILPPEFGWREATELGISNNILDRVIRQARAAGLLTQDPVTRRYRKVAAAA